MEPMPTKNPFVRTPRIALARSLTTFVFFGSIIFRITEDGRNMMTERSASQ